MASEPDAATAALIAQMLREETRTKTRTCTASATTTRTIAITDPRAGRRSAKSRAKEPSPRRACRLRPPRPPRPPRHRNPRPTRPSSRRVAAAAARTPDLCARRRARGRGRRRCFSARRSCCTAAIGARAPRVGTRDHRAFTSHAQKHFIKLCLQGKPLPKKVAETGEGYTLSGKPLDPNSAAASCTASRSPRSRREGPLRKARRR